MNKFKTNYYIKSKINACMSYQFLRIPRTFCGYKILNSKRLSLSDKFLFSLILSFQSQGKPVEIGVRYASRMLGVSNSTAARSINTLLGKQNKHDKQLGIYRPKLVKSRSLYWGKGSHKSVKRRTLAINMDLVNDYLKHHRHSTSKNKNKNNHKSTVKKYHRVKRYNYHRKYYRKRYRSKSPRVKSLKDFIRLVLIKLLRKLD